MERQVYSWEQNTQRKYGQNLQFKKHNHREASEPERAPYQTLDEDDEQIPQDKY